MRPIRWTSLVVLGLLLSGTRGYAGDRWPKKLRPAPAPAAAARAEAHPREPEKNPSWTVKGWGETREDAEQNALKKAQLEVLAYFAERNQSLEWQPDLDYIKKNLVKEWVDEQSEDFGAPVGDLQGVRLRIEVAPKDWQYMLREDRRVRSESRMLVLGKVLAGLVALLGAVAGYLRLEEMTKGYYTAWLRLAAVGFVTAVGAGVWLIS